MKTDTSATHLVSAERYARWVVKWRWPVLFAVLVLSFLATAGASRLGFIDEYRVFFGPDNPQLIAFDAVEAIYTKNDNILMISVAYARELAARVEEENPDYWAEDAEGNQMPMLNGFVKKDDDIYHFWGSELLYGPTGGETRHVDALWPLWNLFDLTPEGRGTDWYPKLSYE